MSKNAVREEGEPAAYLASVHDLAASLVKPLERLRRIKPGRVDEVEQIQEALRGLPDPQAVADAVSEIRRLAAQYTRDTLERRRDHYGRIEAEFVRRKKADKVAIREVADGWRVGPVYLRRDNAGRVAAVYNHEELIPFRPIARFDDLEGLEREALRQLNESRLSDEALTERFWEAYRICASRPPEGRLVPIREFYVEVRLAIVRQELGKGRPDRKLTATTEFPVWAFLYNLDSYIALGGKVPEDKRVGLQTGSQAQQAKNMAMTTNGLDADGDYKAYCFVVSGRSSGAR